MFSKDVLNGILVYIDSKSSNMWKLIGFFEPIFLGALSSPLSRVDQLLCFGSKDAEILSPREQEQATTKLIRFQPGQDSKHVALKDD